MNLSDIITLAEIIATLRREIIECSDCKGKGWKHIPHWWRTETEDCQRCAGYGKLSVKFKQT